MSSSGIDCTAPAPARPPGRPIGRAHRFVRRLAAALIVVALLPGAQSLGGGAGAVDGATGTHNNP